MKAERHLFGSFDGYQTLAASPGVSDAEAAELSEFGFGQTSDQATLEGLSRRLCVLGRPTRVDRRSNFAPSFWTRPDSSRCGMIFGRSSGIRPIGTRRVSVGVWSRMSRVRPPVPRRRGMRGTWSIPG